MKCKILLTGAVILVSAVLGDYCDVKDNFIDPVRYRNIKIDQDCYQKPFQLRKKYKINKKGNLELYIGSNDEWYKVEKGLRVNERSIGELLKEGSEEVKEYIKKKIDALMQ